MKSFLCIKLTLFIILASCSLIGNGTNDLSSYISEKAIELNNAGDLDKIINKSKDKSLVLLGEASHGTLEYYTWRDSISRILIEDNGFNFILVEGDFASIFELNRYVKNLPGAAESAKEVLMALDRWPQWMWGNHEIINLAEWLRQHNDNLSQEEKVGFYGMDVYDEWTSAIAIKNMLKVYDTKLFEKVDELYSCFDPYLENIWFYARDVGAGNVDCSPKTQEVVDIIKRKKNLFKSSSEYDYFYLLQNAKVVLNAERFYRLSVIGNRQDAWNARATHMFETAKRLNEFYGEGSKGIVWAHNTHIGDAYQTDMRHRGEVNIGQLSREHYGKDNVFLIGFTTYQGSVMAGMEWGSARRKMNIPPAQENSIEYVMNKVGKEAYYLIFDDEDRSHEQFMMSMGNRAVGVVYNPRYDFRQFVHTIVPMRYDALIFFSETNALTPIHD